MWHEAEQAAREAEAEGFDCEVLDLRSLQPLDVDAIVASVSRRPDGRWWSTRRRAPAASAPSCRPSSRSGASSHLEAPVTRVTGFDTPFPYALENEYLPRAPRILRAIREVVAY